MEDDESAQPSRTLYVVLLTLLFQVKRDERSVDDRDGSRADDVLDFGPSSVNRWKRIEEFPVRQARERSRKREWRRALEREGKRRWRAYLVIGSLATSGKMRRAWLWL